MHTGFWPIEGYILIAHNTPIATFKHSSHAIEGARMWAEANPGVDYTVIYDDGHWTQQVHPKDEGEDDD